MEFSKIILVILGVLNSLNCNDKDNEKHVKVVSCFSLARSAIEKEKVIS